MKRLDRALDRGLYIVWRDWLYWRTFAWFVVLVAAVFGLGTAIWVTVEEYTAHDWHVFGVYALSEFLLFLPFAPDKTKKIRDLDGEILVWTIDAITFRDYGQLQLALMFTAITVLIANLIVDLLYGWLDPRVRYR